MQRQVADEMQEWHELTARGVQEIARLKANIASANAQHEALCAGIERETQRAADLRSTAPPEVEEFGVFAGSDRVMANLDDLALNVEALHELDAEVRLALFSRMLLLLTLIFVVHPYCSRACLTLMCDELYQREV